MTLRISRSHIGDNYMVIYRFNEAAAMTLRISVRGDGARV